LIDKANDVDENTERFEAGDLRRKKFDIAEAGHKGIMSIAFEVAPH